MKHNKIIKNFLHGVCMGTFEVVPGISGGTLAVLLNIYDKLIISVSHIRSDFKNSIRYLTPLVLGMVFGIFTFSYVVLFFKENYPMETDFFLLGLVLGLTPMLLTRAVGSKFKLSNTISLFLMLIFMFAIVYFSIIKGTGTETIESFSLFTFFKFMAVGCLSSVCLILPGCSGTMVMLVFGIYYTVMEAIHSLNILILLPLGIGIVIGLLFGAKVVEYFFKKFPEATYFGILGLIIGSSLPLYNDHLNAIINYIIGIVNKTGITNYQANELNHLFWHGIISIIVLVIGLIFSFLFTRKTKEIDMKKEFN